MSNILAGQFSSRSSVEILGSYEVAAKSQTYRFTIELGDNDIPLESLMLVQWPEEWQLDCEEKGKYTVSCARGCQFANKALVCDQSSNTLKLYGGFTTARSYLSADTGQLTFSIGGVDNPSDTAGQSLTVSTLQSDSGLYQIDSSFE